MNISAAYSTSDLRAFGDYFFDGTARSLTLLRAIEETVVALRATRAQFEGFLPVAESLASGLAEIKEKIDDDIIASYEHAGDALEKLHELLLAKHLAAEESTELRDDDGVCEAYKETLGILRGLHEAVEHLRWILMVHNGMLESSPSGRELSGESEIREFLNSL